MTDNQKNTLPKSWKLKTLGEVCEVLDNKRKPINSEERQNRIIGKSQDKLYPYYGSTGQVGFIDDYLIDGNFILLGEDGAPFLDSAKEKAYLISGKSWVNNHAHILKAKDKISSNIFVKHFLNILNYEGYVNGTTRLKLNQSSMKDIQIPLPPLPEQQRIVQKIESLFTELETGTKALKTALNQIKIYRQAVLNHFLNDDKDWNTLMLGEVVEKIQIGPFGTQLHKHDYISDGIPLINPTHIKNGQIIVDLDLTVSKDKYLELSNYYLREGDTILGRRGEMGRCALINKNEDGWLCGTGSLFVRPNTKLSNPKLLALILSSLKVKTYLENEASGSTMSNLNLKILKNLPISLPPLEIQTQIVSEIEKRMAAADALEASLKSQLINAENLRQSILKRAFEGKLV